MFQMLKIVVGTILIIAAIAVAFRLDSQDVAELIGYLLVPLAIFILGLAFVWDAVKKMRGSKPDAD